MKTKWIWMLLTVLLLGLSVWALMPKPLQVELASVEQGRFERFVQEDGKTRLKNRYVVSSPVGARLDRITLQPGDVVKRGAVLATLWPQTPALLDERTLASAQARLRAAQAQLARAAANRERAKIAAAQAEQERLRLASLSQAGFVSESQIQAATLQAQQRMQEERMARLEQEAAQEALRVAQADVNTYTPGAERAASARLAAWPVRSPVDGVVLKVHQASEDVVLPGAPLIELGQPQDLEVVVDVLTQEAAQIKAGQRANLGRWGGAGVLQARVRLVEPAAFTKVSALGVQEQRVNVVLDLETPYADRQQLGDGFKVEVRILVQAQDAVLMVPVSALFTQGDQSMLFRLDGERVVRQPVKVMDRNGRKAWVEPLPGGTLATGTQVVIYPPSTLGDGQAVQARNAAP